MNDCVWIQADAQLPPYLTYTTMKVNQIVKDNLHVNRRVTEEITGPLFNAATNALLERKSDPVALLVNESFRDSLYIGNQARPKVFELDIQKPSNLYRTVSELNCRIIPAQKDTYQLEESMVLYKNKNWRILQVARDSQYFEICSVNEDEVTKILQLIKDRGINSLAVVLAHNYSCAEHELKVDEIAYAMTGK
uniref:Hydant_A_N domain-containing protein n=1 Tax=Glossina brevipalpis TaxID=37001 RepID=A0A1A9W3I9_9MUSC